MGYVMPEGDQRVCIRMAKIISAGVDRNYSKDKSSVAEFVYVVYCCKDQLNSFFKEKRFII